MIKNPQAALPPGFRFHPTDEELILHYLRKKVASTPFAVSVIADVDIYKFNPWDLPAKATSGEKEWYFFSPRDRKYPNGVRPNRAAASGYWKATGTDKIITASPGAGINGGQGNIGVKKALVFYKGRPPKGVKTNWIMHEYRLADTFNNSYNMKPTKPKDSSMRLDDWVLCRIYKKSHSAPSSTAAAAAAARARAAVSSDQDQEEEQEGEEEQVVQETRLPDHLSNTPPLPQKSVSFSNLLDAMDYSILRSVLSDNHFNELPPSSSSYAAIPDQTCFSNCNTSSYISSGNNIGTPLFQKLPQLSTPMPKVENSKLKRQRFNSDEDMQQQYQSKKLISSCSLISNSTTQNDHMGQYNFLNQTFLNQQLFPNLHLQFQG